MQFGIPNASGFHRGLDIGYFLELPIDQKGCTNHSPTEILTNPILAKSTNEEGKSREKNQNKCAVQYSKQTTQPHSAGMHMFYFLQHVRFEKPCLSH